VICCIFIPSAPFPKTWSGDFRFDPKTEPIPYRNYATAAGFLEYVRLYAPLG